MQQNQIIHLIISNLQVLAKDLVENKIYGDLNWTVQVKKCLGGIGKNYGFKVCTSLTNDDFEREWLYDLVWYKESEDGFLIEVPLVVESEWKRDLRKDIKFDFEKLLLARSTVKLMICNTQKANFSSFLQYFQKAVDICPLVTVEDVFLIAILELQGNAGLHFDFFEIRKI